MTSGSSRQDAEPLSFDQQYEWVAGGDPQTDTELSDFFHSPEIEQLKRQLCRIGRRMWQREYTDGNGGNLSIRVGDGLVLATPTLISKGFMKPEHICLVDLSGNQLAGSRARTSELFTHLGVMKNQPDAKACCHAHPPFATAFAVAGIDPPRRLTPESEIFLGEIALSDYKTPGSNENAAEVGRLAIQHPAILMKNHGVITWARCIEHAYWRMENVETYCKTVWVASHLKSPLPEISGEDADQLQRIRQNFPM